MRKNIAYIFSIVILLVFGVTSCTKYDGYYDYQNSEKVFNGNSLTYLQSKPGVFDSVLLVLDRIPYLKTALEQEQVTLFAPTNSSFQSALSNLNLVRDNQKKPRLNIKTLKLSALDSLMNKYVAEGKVSTDSMLYIDGLFVKTYKYDHPMHAQRQKENASGLIDGGIELLYFSDTKNNSFQTQWTRSTSQAVNILSTNGVVHVLSARHEFGFGDFLTKMNN